MKENSNRPDRLILVRNRQESMYLNSFERLLSYEYQNDWLGMIRYDFNQFSIYIYNFISFRIIKR